MDIMDHARFARAWLAVLVPVAIAWLGALGRAAASWRRRRHG